MVPTMLWKLGVPIVAAMVFLAASAPGSASAQQAQAVSNCPPPEALHGVEVCVDRGPGSVYYEGDPITICFTVNVPVIAIYPPPPPPLVRVTNSVSGGPPQVIYEEYMQSGQRCLNRTIVPPLGHEVIRAEVIGRDGRLIGSDQTTYTSLPRSGPAQGSISVDRGAGAVYNVNDPIRICYDVPAPGPVTITDILANGTQQVLLSGYDDGTGGCFNGIVTPPAGTECLRLDYSTSAGSGSTQTCFQVVGSGPPPANAFISVDRSVYRVGDPIHICYDVPGPGPVTVTSLLPGGGSRVLLSGYEDGTGACFTRSLGSETGIKCIRLDFSGDYGSGSRQTCFRVTT